MTQYLQAEEYFLDHHLFRRRLLSDPDKGVVSISNTFDYFKIKNLVAKVPKTSIDQLPKFFIAQLGHGKRINFVLVKKQNKDQFELILERNKSFILSKDEFLLEWTGLIIVIEKNADKKHLRNFAGIWMKSALAICSLCAVMYIQIQTGALFASIYLTTSIIGLILSFLIIQEKLRIGETPSRICSFSKSTDCQTVLHTKEAKLFGKIDLSDASIVYFSFLVLAFLLIPNHKVFMVLTSLSLPMIPYSLYHQYLNIKKWCPLCLGIAIILAIQFVSLFQIQNELETNYINLIPLCSILGIVTLSWPQIKSLLEVKGEHISLSLENLTFRRNHHMFLAYYNSLSTLTIPQHKSFDLKLGCNDPIIKLSIITNPLCKSCKSSFQTYKKLQSKYPETLQAQFIFLVSSQHRADPRTQISERLIQLFYEEGALVFNRAIDEWFAETNVKDWQKKWGMCDNIAYNNLLADQVKWCLQHELLSTPATLINGKLLPESYHSQDIEHFIEPISTYERNIRHDIIKDFHA